MLPAGHTDDVIDDDAVKLSPGQDQLLSGPLPLLGAEPLSGAALLELLVVGART
jgi:hypothetical protein